MSLPRRILTAAALLLVVVPALSAAPASAHSKLVSTSPADGAVLDTPPAEVSFTFDEPLLAGTDTISINDEQGNVVASGPATVDGATISLPWPADATEGTFQAAYRVVSDDGHPVTGAITITISGATESNESVAATAEPVAAAEPARGVAGSLVVIVAVGVLVLVVVAGVTLWRRRRR